MLKRLKTHFKAKKIVLYLLGAFIAVNVFSFAFTHFDVFGENNIAQAQTDPANPPTVDPPASDTQGGVSPGTTGASETETRLGEIAALFVSLFTPILAFMVEIAGQLLGNDWIYQKGAMANASDAAIDMEALLNQVWIIIRDLVNICFILVLLAIAFVNVLGAGQEWSSKFNLGQTLPKIAIALVAVNFTWFGAKIILDASNVATHVVFGIFETASEKMELHKKVEGKICIPKDIIVNFKGADLTPQQKEAMAAKIRDHNEAIQNGDTIDCGAWPKEYGKITFGEWQNFEDFDDPTGPALMELFAFGVLHVETLPITTKLEGQKITSLTIESVVSLVLMVILMVAMFAMVVVLLVRIVMVWINIVLSPIFALLPILSDIIPGTDSMQEHVSIKAFITYAFLPAMMSLPLVIGMIMVMAGKVVLPPPTSELGEMQIAGSGEIINNIHSIQALLWYGIAVVMVWMSVEVAVKNGGKISETIVGTVSNGVKGAGKWLAKLPLYANFIPVYNKGDSEEGAKKVSLGGMWGAMQGFGNTFRSNKITEANKALGITNPERDKISDTEWNRLKTLDPSSDDSLLKDFAANLKRTGNYNQAIRSTGGLARNTDLKSALNNLNPTERQGLITRLEELTGDRLDAARASIGTTDPGGDSNNPSSADLTSRSIITVNNGAVEINGSSISGVNLSSLDSSQSNAIIQAINNLESNQDKEAALYQLFDSLNPNQEREIINAIPNNSDLRNLATVQEKIRQLEAQGDS